MDNFVSTYVWPAAIIVGQSLLLLVCLLVFIAYILLADRKIVLALDKKATDWLANAGYDPVYGARPLKRVIQRRLQDPLAQLILEGKIGDGAKVKVSASKTGLVINGEEFAARADDLGDALPVDVVLN